MKNRDQVFNPPVSVRVVADGDGHGAVREDRFEGVKAVLFGNGGSLNVQQRDKATMYPRKMWRSWEVVGS